MLLFSRLPEPGHMRVLREKDHKPAFLHRKTKPLFRIRRERRVLLRDIGFPAFHLVLIGAADHFPAVQADLDIQIILVVFPEVFLLVRYGKNVEIYVISGQFMPI